MFSAIGVAFGVMVQLPAFSIPVIGLELIKHNAGFGAAPTKYELELTFEELEILVQQRIDQGY
jgi:hypothetical protein